MKKMCLIILLLTSLSYAISIENRAINFTQKRINLTKEYIKLHYDLKVNNIEIIPKMIVIHHTGIDDFERSYSRFLDEILPFDRPDISKGGLVNVSTQFMIDRNGTIFRLMPELYMARHVIGLNYSSIGIENVGGEDFKDNLTPAQLQSNIDLVNYLKDKYQTIEYLIGHYEYQYFENNPLWLEKDHKYRTIKHDPSERFMEKLRENIEGLN